MSALRKLLAAIEPWYDWGDMGVERMEGWSFEDDGYGRSGGDGFVRYFQLQWFGIHLGFQIGRTPKRDVPGRVKVEPAIKPKLPEDSDPAHVFENHARWVAGVEQPAVAA